MKNDVVTRFAPSPTGFLHAGNYRTAIFAYLFAKKTAGQFIVRIEDTDKERSKKEYDENIVEVLEWLGLEYDALYRQSDHVTRHKELLRNLIAQDKAYISQEEVKEEGQRPTVIRFRNPNIKLTFTDAVRGDITFDTEELGDFIIAKSESEPLYHFGVVVDDIDEGVTHVIRGDDHISNTPRQILIRQALGAQMPIFAHLPLVLDANKAKLSKRRGAKALTEYRDQGFIPEAMINYLALLGWHPEGDQELFSVAELIEVFDLSRIQKSAGVFDEVKLRWFNHEHLKRLDDTDYESRLRIIMQKHEIAPPSYLKKALPLLKERYDTLLEAALALKDGEYDYLGDAIGYEPELLTKGSKTEAKTAAQLLGGVSDLLEELHHNEFTGDKVKEIVFPYAEEHGRAQVLWPLRIALSGKEKSPDPFTLCELIGKETALKRIAQAIQKL